MEKFGITNNFIYMDDDYFFGQPLKKFDFFYYDEEKKKIIPYLITSKFYEINKTYVFNNYYLLYNKKYSIHPHSSEGFWLGMFNTEKFFIEHYNLPLFSTDFTHNAISENINELKEIFEEAKKYIYFNKTLFSKERYILSLHHKHFLNLYQLNIKHKKVHSLRKRYFLLENIKFEKTNIPLFVINTGGNHIPTYRQKDIFKKIILKRFPFPSKYEIKYIINIIL